MTAGWLTCVYAAKKESALPVPAIPTDPVPFAENAFPPVSPMKNIFVPNFLNRLMSVMVVLSGPDVPLKNISTKPPMPRKNTNRSEPNPVPVLHFPKLNSNRLMMLFPLF